MKYVCLFYWAQPAFAESWRPARIPGRCPFGTTGRCPLGRGASAGQRPSGRYGIRGAADARSCSSTKRRSGPEVAQQRQSGRPGSVARSATADFRRTLQRAFDLCDENFSLHASHGMPYQTAGSLLLDFPGHRNVSDFYRDLDLATATATVGYAVDGIRYKREMFTSFSDQVAVVRLTASERRRISFRISFATPMQNYRVTTQGERPAADRRQNRRP